MARIERKTKRYPSDLTDEEWAAMAPLMPGAARTPAAKHRSAGNPERDGAKRKIELFLAGGVIGSLFSLDRAGFR